MFIEPAEVVEANNLTRELQMEEHREIIRILTVIADSLRPSIPAIIEAAGIIYHLDFIQAKALYADAVGGLMPHLHNRQELEWYHACHPGLKLSLEKHGREIVPIDVTPDIRATHTHNLRSQRRRQVSVSENCRHTPIHDPVWYTPACV